MHKNNVNNEMLQTSCGITNDGAQQMAVSDNISEDTEFAKTKIMQMQVDEKCKKTLISLLSNAAAATNGISLEQKVQKITESIVGLVISQIAFLDSVEKKIKISNDEKCAGCKAMKLANDIEEEKKKEQIINAWKESNGIKDSDIDASKMSVGQILKVAVVKPYIWFAVAALGFSPYCGDIIKALGSFFGK